MSHILSTRRKNVVAAKQYVYLEEALNAVQKCVCQPSVYPSALWNVNVENRIS